nr:TlpA disulfide reductase family protein [uncultured Flavobacterium sp.]
MKTIYFFLACLCALTIQAKPVTIKGKINGKLPEVLRYSAPVNGVLGFDIYYAATVDAQGNFEIKTDVNEISFIDVFYNYINAGNLVVTPGGQYSIILTEKDGKITHEITGTNAPFTKLYDTLIPDYRVNLIHNFGNEGSKIESPDELKAFFDTKLKSDLAALKAAKPKTLSESDFEMIVREREYFYANALSLALYTKYTMAKYDQTGAVPDAFNAVWKEVFVKHPADKAFIRKLPLGYWFLISYDFFSTFQAVGFDGKKIPEDENLTEEQKRERRLLYIPSENKEYYFALVQHFNVNEGRLEKYALDSYYEFKKYYPKSTYTKYLEPEMQPLISFFDRSDALPAGASYVEDYGTVNSLEELLKKMPGKKLYVDVWATWCHSCRDEFKHKEELYKLLAKDDVAVLYISVDEDSRNEGWKKMIGYYGLKGYHIRVNKTLYKNLSDTFSNGGGLALPWYFLVNNNGKIGVKYAAPPSDLEKLKTQLGAL